MTDLQRLMHEQVCLPAALTACLCGAYARVASQEIERLRDRCEARAAEIIRLREDAERPKCAYCDFGEKDQVTLDLLKWHIEKECAAHPIYQMMRELDAARERETRLRALTRYNCDCLPSGPDGQPSDEPDSIYTERNVILESDVLAALSAGAGEK